jgi:hypothetical protein
VHGERELRAVEREAGRLIASAPIGTDGRQLHRPDLALQPYDGSPAFAVEVELSVKTQRRLEEICRAWARARHLAGVVYYAAPAALRALERAVAATYAHERIELRALS